MGSCLIGGIDESGKGPVLGPLVIGFVLVDSSGEEQLKKLRVRDSKMTSPQRRTKLFPLILECAQDYLITEISAKEIDHYRLNEGLTLGEIEAIEIAETINKLEPPKVIVDSAENDTSYFENLIRKHLTVDPKIIVEHQADEKYLPVSAASILAKVRRDQVINELSQKYGDVGSGYPSDPKTKFWLRSLIRTNGWVNSEGLPDFIRQSWVTVQRLIDQKAKQTFLDEY